MERTCDSIIEWFEGAVKNKEVIPPNLFLEAAVNLNVLLGGEHERLFDLEQIVSRLKLKTLEGQDKRNVSEAKMVVEASDEYRSMKSQSAKVERIIEFVRLAKVHARIANDEYRGN